MGEAIMFIFQLGLKCQILFLNSFYIQVSQLGGVFHSWDQMDCNIRHHVHQQFRFCFLEQTKKKNISSYHTDIQETPKQRTRYIIFKMFKFFKIPSNLSGDQNIGVAGLSNWKDYFNLQSHTQEMPKTKRQQTSFQAIHWWSNHVYISTMTKVSDFVFSSFSNEESQLGGVFHSGDQMDCSIGHHVLQQFRFCFLDQIKKRIFQSSIPIFKRRQNRRRGTSFLKCSFFLRFLQIWVRTKNIGVVGLYRTWEFII